VAKQASERLFGGFCHVSLVERSRNPIRGGRATRYIFSPAPFRLRSTKAGKKDAAPIPNHALASFPIAVGRPHFFRFRIFPFRISDSMLYVFVFIRVTFVSMETTRQKKVSRVIQRELGIYFQRNSSSYAKGGMITVTQVRVSPDLGIAKIYLSIFAVPDKQAVVALITERTWEVRKYIASERNELRIAPDLHFYIDDSLDQIERIDDLLKE
jgi:ribosome-binding factor A